MQKNMKLLSGVVLALSLLGAGNVQAAEGQQGQQGPKQFNGNEIVLNGLVTALVARGATYAGSNLLGMTRNSSMGLGILTIVLGGLYTEVLNTEPLGKTLGGFGLTTIAGYLATLSLFPVKELGK